MTREGVVPSASRMRSVGGKEASTGPKPAKTDVYPPRLVALPPILPMRW